MGPFVSPFYCLISWKNYSDVTCFLLMTITIHCGAFWVFTHAQCLPDWFCLWLICLYYPVTLFTVPRFWLNSKAILCFFLSDTDVHFNFSCCCYSLATTCTLILFVSNFSCSHYDLYALNLLRTLMFFLQISSLQYFYHMFSYGRLFLLGSSRTIANMGYSEE